MKSLLGYLFLFTLLIANSSLASAKDQSLDNLERQRQLLESHQKRLESLLFEHGKRIERLKLQSPGVGRDMQLDAALRSSQAIANRLTDLHKQLKVLQQTLLQHYQIAIEKQKDPQILKKLLQRRNELTRQMTPAKIQIVINSQPSSTDTAEDLEEKADLLKDSEEKVRRQLKQLTLQIKQLEHRGKLYRHSIAADDNPFIESSPRKTSRTGSSPTANSKAEDRSAPEAKENDPTSSYGSSDEPGPLSGDTQSIPAPSDVSHGGTVGENNSISFSIGDVLDPTALNNLQLAEKSGDYHSQLVALKTAKTKLEYLADQLALKAKNLEAHAKTMRKK